MGFSPQWHALGTEAELAGSQIALGVTALGRANHTRVGDYTIAFFSLAIGLERLGKLIVIADYAIKNQGKFPDDKFLRDTFRHNLALLLDHCEALSGTRQQQLPSEHSKRPKDTVHQGIVQTLSEFAIQTRYYNLDLVTGGKAPMPEEPVRAWWKRVGGPILSQHYTARQKQKDKATADALDESLREYVMVRHHCETGESIDDLAALIRRNGASRVVQKFGRLYVLQIVRWLSYLIAVLAHEGGKHNIEPLFGVEEPFHVFWNDDRYFLRRKTWAIYP
jgi:hypothetical protein